MAVQKRNSTET